jgi:hypothetical protein
VHGDLRQGQVAAAFRIDTPDVRNDDQVGHKTTAQRQHKAKTGRRFLTVCDTVRLMRDLGYEQRESHKMTGPVSAPGRVTCRLG